MLDINSDFDVKLPDQPPVLFLAIKNKIELGES